MKKKPTPEQTPLPPGVERYTVGKAFSKQERYRISLLPPHPPGSRVIAETPGRNVNPFEYAFSRTEADARRILEQAGLPSDPAGFYTIPEGEKHPFPTTIEEAKAIASRSSTGKAGGLMELVKDRGFREREDREWYAAEILSLARIIRANVGRGEPWAMISLAAQLGELVGEGTAHGYFEAIGGANKGTGKNLPPVAALVRHLIRKNRKATARELWKMIPTDTFNGIRIEGIKFYRNGARLLALGKVEGYIDWRPVGRPLQFGAFKKRVGKERKPPAR